MEKYFTYRLLRYRYSAVLDEIFNIGLLVTIPGVESQFLFPNNLKRIKEIYPETDEKHLKYYLDTFKKLTLNFNQSNRIELFFKEDPKKYIQQLSNYLITPDDSSLYFGKIQTCLVYTPNTDKIVSQLFEEYFFPYEKPIDKRILNDEKYLQKAIRDNIKKVNGAIYRKHFQNLEPIKISNNQTHLKFDLYWPNNTTHFVQPIGFDLKKADSIDNKANRFFGKFFQLEEAAKQENAQFDAIVSRPKDRKLFKTYDSALQILEKAPCTVYEEEKLTTYVDQVITGIEEHLRDQGTARGSLFDDTIIE